MDAKQLMFFKRTAELEHMTKAADELMVSQPFLSRTIAELEKELEVELFDHVGRRIVLNACGRAFYKRVLNIFNEAEDARREVQEIYHRRQTTLTIVTNVSLYMPGLLKTLAERSPDLKIIQLSARRRKIVKMLQNGEVDFAICCPPLEDDAELSTVHLRFEPGVIVYPDGHWLANHSEATLHELKDEAIISVAQGFGVRDALDALFQKHGLLSRISIETTDTSAIFRYVSAGLGVALVPLSQVLEDPALKYNYTRLSNKTEKTGEDIALTWRRSRYIKGEDKLFIEKAKEYFYKLEEFVQKNCVK